MHRYTLHYLVALILVLKRSKASFFFFTNYLGCIHFVAFEEHYFVFFDEMWKYFSCSKSAKNTFIWLLAVAANGYMILITTPLSFVVAITNVENIYIIVNVNLTIENLKEKIRKESVNLFFLFPPIGRK